MKFFFSIYIIITSYLYYQIQKEKTLEESMSSGEMLALALANSLQGKKLINSAGLNATEVAKKIQALNKYLRRLNFLTVVYGLGSS